MNLMRKNLTSASWDPFTIFEELERPRFFVPAVDVHEEENQYVLRTDLPGINKENLDVSVAENVLTIRGERKEENEKKEKGYWYSERWTGSFQRSLELPAEADASKIKASFKDGVLELIVPKSEKAAPKQIKVELK